MIFYGVVMSENNFFVSGYQTSQFAEIVNLWNEQYDNEYIQKRKPLFKWITEKNPFLEGRPPYFLLLDNDKVVGMHGHMPLLFTCNGQKLLGAMAHDDLISKEYRGKGLGKVMLNGTAMAYRTFAGALWFNEPNYRLYVKSGWLDVPDLHSFVKIYNPEIFLENRITNKFIRKAAAIILKIGFKLKNAVRNPEKNKQITIKEIKRFDQSFDDLFDKTSASIGISVVRDSRYLNWRFIEKPFINYSRFAAYDLEQNLEGYMVVHAESNNNQIRGKIIDFMVLSDRSDVFNALIKASCDRLIENDAEYIQIITSNVSAIQSLYKNGFNKSKSPFRFMVVNWEKEFEKEFIQDIHNWYITESDADGGAWTIDE